MWEFKLPTAIKKPKSAKTTVRQTLSRKTNRELGIME
jgi:hypothetical protein